MNAATSVALDRFLAAVSAAGESYRNGPGGYRTRCLAHDGTDENLAISQGKKGVVVTCHSHQCSSKDIAEAYGMAETDLFNDSGDSEALRQRKADLWMPCQGKNNKVPCQGYKAAEYHYLDLDGSFLFATCRCSRKKEGCKNAFAQWRKDPSKKPGKSWNLTGVKRVPYKLPELTRAIEEGRTVYIVEGEKDVERLMSLGFAATSSPLGAGHWINTFAAYFRGAKVVIVADRDTKGFKHARDIYRSLTGIAESIVAQMPAVSRKGADVSDHLDAGFTVEQLVPAVEEESTEVVDPIPVIGDSVLDSVLDPEVEALFATSAPAASAVAAPVVPEPVLPEPVLPDMPLIPEPSGALVMPEAPDRRTPMSDVHVERTVLGSMTFNPALLEGAVDRLTEGDFTVSAHGAIFTTLMSMYAANIAVDPDTVADFMARNGTFRLINSNRDYLYQLMGFHTDPDLMAQHIRILVERSSKRKIAQVLSQAMSRNQSDQWSPEDLVEAATIRLQEAVSVGVSAEKLSLADRLPEYRDRRLNDDEMPGLESPWKQLNEVVAFTPKRVLTVGAGTGVGKSLVAAQWAAYTGLTMGLPTLVFSMEMAAFEIMDRFTANLGGLNLTRLSNADLKGEKFAKLKRDQGEQPGRIPDITHQFMETTSLMEEADHLWICDDGTVTTSRIRATVRAMEARGMKPALLVVDYIQLVEAEGQFMSDVKALEKISRDLKRIAMDFELCVLSVAQFNRDTKGREPVVQDFKGSSAIEQDSDIILILHSEVDGETGKVLDKSEIEMIVAKNRGGASDRRIKLIGQQHYAKFAEPGRDA